MTVSSPVFRHWLAPIGGLGLTAQSLLPPPTNSLKRVAFPTSIQLRSATHTTRPGKQTGPLERRAL